MDEADGLIFMGGPMSVNDDLPYIRQELRLIEEAVARGKPVLGVCLGAQLIAKALGGRVYANPVKEIGWYPVRFTEAARAEDRLFAGVICGRRRSFTGTARRSICRRAELLASSDGLPAPGVSRWRQCLRIAISPGSHAGNDRRLVRAGCQLRRHARDRSAHRSAP